MARPEILDRLLMRSTPGEEIPGLVEDIIQAGLMDAKLPSPHTDCSVLTFLVERGFTKQAVRLIEAGADIRAGSSIGYQPIHAAASVNDVVVLSALLARGASLHDRVRDGATAVHFAFSDRLDIEVASLVLDHLRAPSHAFTKRGSVGYTNKDTVWELLSRYGSPRPVLMEVLDLLAHRGMIQQLRQSTTKSDVQSWQALCQNLRARFPDMQVEQWLDSACLAADLGHATPEPAASSRPTRRF